MEATRFQSKSPSFRDEVSPFSGRKQQTHAPPQIGDVGEAAEMSDFDDSGMESVPDVEAAADIVDIPADETPDATPEGPEQQLSTYQNHLDTVDVKDTLGAAYNPTDDSARNVVERVANNEPFKAIVIGNAGVGKSRLTYIYVHQKQPTQSSRNNNIAFELFSKEVIVPMTDKSTHKKINKSINVQFYDTAGQEKYDAITKAHYRKSMGALVCYAVTDLESFQAVDKWIRQVKEHAGPHCNIVLVGTKSDVIGSKRLVQYEAGQKLAEFYAIPFYEVSALQNYGVREAVEALAAQMIISYEQHIAGGGTGIRRPRREINSRTAGDEVEGSFSLGCCGTRKTDRNGQEAGCC